MFSSCSLWFHGCTFISFFIWILFWYGVRYRFNFTFFQMAIFLSQYHLLNSPSFFPVIWDVTFIRYHLPKIICISEFSVIFHWSIYATVTHCWLRILNMFSCLIGLVVPSLLLFIFKVFQAVMFFFFWSCSTACRILVPQPGIEPRPLAVKAQGPNHWAARDFPRYSCFRFFLLIFSSCVN